jgi:uncharacterized protein YebE (UPF0316 family)
MEFLNDHKVLLYALIFFGKILGGTVGVLWLILVNRGERLKASIVSLFDVTIWLLIASTVLIGFQQDLLKVVFYVTGTAVGIYIGATLEENLALGFSSIQVIIAQDNMAHVNVAEELAKKLRNNSFAVTIMEGRGKQGKRDVLLLHLKRKRIKKALTLIREDLKNAMITVNDVSMVRGGYLKK